MNLTHLFGQTEIVFIINIGLAILIGGLIGFERESRHKDAGISTTTFVIAGSMLFTYISHVGGFADTSRIAAQIVTGIGFLGAGLIIRDGSNIKNMTTAAGIWFAGAIGMALGFGFYVIAIVSAVVAICAPRIPYYKKDIIASGLVDEVKK